MILLGCVYSLARKGLESAGWGEGLAFWKAFVFLTTTGVLLGLMIIYPSISSKISHTAL